MSLHAFASTGFHFWLKCNSKSAQATVQALTEAQLENHAWHWLWARRLFLEIARQVVNKLIVDHVNEPAIWCWLSTNLLLQGKWWVTVASTWPCISAMIHFWTMNALPEATVWRYVDYIPQRLAVLAGYANEKNNGNESWLRSQLFSRFLYFYHQNS